MSVAWSDLSKKIMNLLSFPVAARSNAWVCGRSSAEIVGSNPTVSWMSVPCDYCMLSVRGIWVGLITRLEESY